MSSCKAVFFYSLDTVFQRASGILRWRHPYIRTNRFVLFCTLLAVITAKGETEEDPGTELLPFPVAARASTAADQAAAVGVTSVRPTETLRETTGSLGEMLAWQSGVSSSFYGGAASRPVIRGMEGYRVGIFENSLATGDLSASSPDHAVAVEPLFIESIRLFKGPAALYHGGGAIGGAVDIHPNYIPLRSESPGSGGSLQGHFDSATSGRTALIRHHSRQEDFAFRINLLSRETEDYRIPGAARTEDYDRNNRLRLPPAVRGQVAPNPQGRVPNTHSSTRAVGMGGGWFPGANAITVGFLHYAMEYGVPADGHTHGNPYGQAGITGPGPNDVITIDLKQNRLFAEAHIPLDQTWMDGINAKLSYTDYRQDEWEGSFLGNAFQRETVNSRLETESIGERGRLFLGGSFNAHRYDNRNISYGAGRADEDRLETSGEQLALFGLQEVEWASTVVRVGLRAEHQSARRRDRTDLSRSSTTGSSSLEVEQVLSETWRLATSLTLANRIPDPEELFIEAPHGATGVYAIPNPALEVERSKGAEVRLFRSGERSHFEMSVFYRRFDGFIFLQNEGFEVDGLTAYAQAQRDASFVGGEIQLHWNLLRGTDRRLDLETFFDYLRGQNLDESEPLPRMPPMRAGITLKGQEGPWTGNIQWLHAFSQKRVPSAAFGTLAYQTPSPAYSLLSIGLGREWALSTRSHLEVRLMLTNLLHTEARQHTSFLKDVAPLPGRSIQLGATLHF